MTANQQCHSSENTQSSDGECCNIRSQDYLFPGTFVPMMELSFSGPFVPWNFRSQDYSFPGTFIPWTVRSLELSFPGPFVPWTIRSRE